MFSNKDLKNLILPLFLEQLLTIFVGLADTFAWSRGFSSLSRWRSAASSLCWGLSDRGKRNCAEHLVQRCIGLHDDGTGVYHGDRAVYGCGRQCEIYGFHDKGYGVSKAGV